MTPNIGYGTAPEKQAAAVATQLKSGPGELNLARFAPQRVAHRRATEHVTDESTVEREPFRTCTPCPASGALRMAACTRGLEVTGGSLGHGPDGSAVVKACEALVVGRMPKSRSCSVRTWS